MTLVKYVNPDDRKGALEEGEGLRIPDSNEIISVNGFPHKVVGRETYIGGEWEDVVQVEVVPVT